MQTVAEGMEVLVDAFNQGDLLFIEEVEDIRAGTLLGHGRRRQSADRSLVFDGDQGAKKAFLTRMLTNLKAVYLRGRITNERFKSLNTCRCATRTNR